MTSTTRTALIVAAGMVVVVVAVFAGFYVQGYRMAWYAEFWGRYWWAILGLLVLGFVGGLFKSRRARR